MSGRTSLELTAVIGGAAVLACAAATSLMSRFFLYGSGPLERPIVEFVAVSLTGFTAYFLTLERLRSASKTDLRGRRLILWVIFIAVLCRLVYFPSQFIQETDAYRYAWDGQTLLHGANPYQYSPAESTMPKGQALYERINHAGIRTIYPPLAQVIFALSQMMSPWEFGGLKVLIFLSEIVTLFLLGSALTMTARPVEWLMLYGWSPLALKEFTNSLHVDAFAVLFLSAALLAHFRRRPPWTFAMLACATLVKLFAAALLIPLIVYEWQRDKKEVIGSLTLFCGIILAFYLPFLGAGSGLFEGLSRFAMDWRVNEGLYGILRWMSRMVLSHDLALANQIARIFTAAAFAILTVSAGYWVKRQGTTLSVAQAWLFILSALFFLSPAANPWYFTWLLPLLVILPIRSLILFSGLVFIYYLELFLAYRGVAGWFTLFRTIEYGVFFAFLGWELWPKIKQSPLFCRYQTSAV